LIIGFRVPMNIAMAFSAPVVLRIAALSLALTALSATPAPAAREQRVGASPASATGFVPGRVVVEWDPSVTSGQRRTAREQADADFVRTLGRTRFQLLEVEPGQTVGEAIDALRGDPAVHAVARDSYAVPHDVPNDPLFDQLWGLRNTGAGVDRFPTPLAGADIDAVAAWDRTIGMPGVVLADLDTGYRFDHPDLAAVAWTNAGEALGNGLDDDGNGYVDDVRGWDFVGPDSDLAYAGDADPTDDDVLAGGHGVHTAGTMAAAGGDGVGITGVARNVRVMPLRVCSWSEDVGDATCPSSAQIAAINYAGANGARVANMSLGGPTFNGPVFSALAANAGTLFVVSAGNEGDDNDATLTPTYPCNYPLANVVCVAATDQADHLASFSNVGATSVDLGAPGTETLSTYVDYAFDERYAEAFTNDDFARAWLPTGSDGGFARSSEAPLTSFGMTDTPAAAPRANTEHESTSTGFVLPPGYHGCVLTQRRTLLVATSDGYDYGVLLNGREIVTATPDDSGSGMFSLAFAPANLAAGGLVQLRFRFTTGPSPSRSAGVWLDDLFVDCAARASATPAYRFLDGTSMAAPHVSGAAGLLFSLKPSATVAEVRGALLSSVDPLATLAGATVTGGRLNVAAALAALVPVVVAPPVVAPATVSPPVAVKKCVVPKLRGKTLRRAKRALRRAHCRLGRVVRPALQGRRLPLVVKSSRPRAGAVRAAGKRVRLTMKVKPRRRR
jgi:subtilisin family serine protease